MSCIARGNLVASGLAIALLAGCAVPGPWPGPRQAPSPAPAQAPRAEAARLAGSSWYWLGTLTLAGAVTPRDPGAYNAEFVDGGQLVAQLDCNRGTGAWRQDGTSLSIGRLSGARRVCGGGSLSERFAAQLQAADSARTFDGVLEIELAGGAGTMMLARDPDWRLRSFDCPGAAPLAVVFGRERALVRRGHESWALRRQPGASGVRFGAPGVILFSKDNDATLVVGGRQVAGPCRASDAGARAPG